MGFLRAGFPPPRERHVSSMKGLISLLLVLGCCLLSAETVTIKEFEHQIWQLTNLERAKYQLQPLAYDEGLADLARIHSRNMRKGKFFAHKDKSGDMVGDRKNKYYPQLIVSSIGENLARFSNSARIHTPAEIVEGWMNSPEHKKNILDKDWTHLGVGVVNYADVLFATQNFATSLVKLETPLRKSYSRKKQTELRFKYISPRASTDLNAVLIFPDKKYKYYVNESYFSLGTMPVSLNWEDEATFKVELNFPAGKGKYTLGFGFNGAYFEEGIKLRVK